MKPHTALPSVDVSAAVAIGLVGVIVILAIALAVAVTRLRRAGATRASTPPPAGPPSPGADAAPPSSRGTTAAQAEPARVTYAGLRIFRRPEEIEPRPRVLVGRDAVLAEVETAIGAGRRILLHGFGGNGKTSIASVAAQRVLASADATAVTSVVWLSVQAAGVESVFGALLASYPAGDVTEPGIAVQKALDAARAAGLMMMVLDDVAENSWPVLEAVLDAVPRELPVLVTSRQNFPTGEGRLDLSIPVEGLAPPDALSLLAAHAGGHLPAEASALCAELDHHPLQLVLAGELLKQGVASVDELRAELRDTSERLRTLLDRSYHALNEDARRVFDTFGEFPDQGATAELIGAYLTVAGPAVDVRAALATLTDRSLATRIGRSTYYRIHSLTHSYVRRRAGRDQRAERLRAIQAVRELLKHHDRDDALLALDLRNITSAAEWARSYHPDALVSIVGRLAAHYVEKQGFVGLFNPVDQGACLLTAAISAAGDEERWRDHRHDLLSKRGTARVQYDDLAGAIEDYTAAYDLAPTPERTAVLLSSIGYVEHRRQPDRWDEGETAYRLAYAVAEAAGDRWAQVRVLGLHSNTAFNVRRDFDLAYRLADRGVAIAEDLDRLGDAIPLMITKGSAKFESGVRASIHIHTAQRDSCRVEGDALGVARATAALGLDHHALNDFEEARDLLGEALTLYESQDQPAWARRIRVTMERFGYRARGTDVLPEDVTLAELRSPEFSDGVIASLHVHREALAVAERLSADTDNLAILHQALALDCHALEDTRAALDHLVKARDLFTAAGWEPSAQEIRDFMLRHGYQT